MESNFVRSFIVGGFYPDMKTKHAFIRLSYDGSWELSIGLPYITDCELNDYRHGKLQMALADVYGLIFVLYKFGGQPWCDVPFEPRLSPKPMEYPQIADATLGIGLQVDVYDSATGILKACRLIGLSNELTNRLHAHCTKSDMERPLDSNAYERTLQQAYMRYRRSKDMLQVAGKVYKII